MRSDNALPSQSHRLRSHYTSRCLAPPATARHIETPVTPRRSKESPIARHNHHYYFEVLRSAVCVCVCVCVFVFVCLRVYLSVHSHIGLS